MEAMNTKSYLITHKENLIFLLLFAFAVFLYLFNLNFSDIWIDESFTKALVRHSFRDMMGLIKNDFHPPLYFYGLKLFVTIFGLNNYTIRLFSVIAVLSTLLLGYFAGQRVFGKTGALYFCFLLVTLPMLTSYSHDARMYTWAAFSTTGILIYAILFIQTSKKSDLIFLELFSLLAAYTHYYGLFAAFWANVFVFVYLIFKKNKAWVSHLVSLIITAILYLPWLSVLLKHTQKAQIHFWVPKVSWQTIASCFTQPFAQKLFMANISYILMAIIYILTLIVIYRIFFKARENKELKLILLVSLVIFYMTIITTTIISFFLQPILYSRYIMTIVTMLMVPPTLFFIIVHNKWIKSILMIILFSCSVYIAYGSSYFSYGPYKQSIDFLMQAHPELKKVVHVIEVTAGPLAEYSRSTDIQNYWYNPKGTIVYTNMAAYDNLIDVKNLDDFLTKDEVYCINTFSQLPFNQENFEAMLAQSTIMQVDTVTDNKVKYGWQFLLYILKYN